MRIIITTFQFINCQKIIKSCFIQQLSLSLSLIIKLKNLISLINIHTLVECIHASSRLPTNIFKIILINSKFACKYMHIKINITKIWAPPVFDLYICGPQHHRPWPPRPVVSRSGSYSWVPPPQVLWGSSPGTASLQSSVSCHLHYISKKGLLIQSLSDNAI